VKLEHVPDWENDPIETICAPISALLVTRISPWYTLTTADKPIGLKKKKPAGERLRDNARAVKWRARQKK
jgi:hypothetical protein